MREASNTLRRLPVTTLLLLPLLVLAERICHGSAFSSLHSTAPIRSINSCNKRSNIIPAIRYVPTTPSATIVRNNNNNNNNRCSIVQRPTSMYSSRNNEEEQRQHSRLSPKKKLLRLSTLLLLFRNVVQCLLQKVRWTTMNNHNNNNNNKFRQKRFRRKLTTFVAASLLWLGVATVTLISSPAHATTATATATAETTVVERELEKSSPSLDQIVDRYVQDNMFNDDDYDPIESTYREAYDDATKGTYPQALREVAADVLGEQKVKDAVAEGRADRGRGGKDGTGFGGMLTRTISQLQKRGLSESASIIVLASLFVIAGPSVFLFTGMIVGGMSKRNINRVMKKRYGDTYTVDATIKTEEEVVAPEDEDDEDDDEDEDDEDDEEEDDDDEDDV